MRWGNTCVYPGAPKQLPINDRQHHRISERHISGKRNVYPRTMKQSGRLRCGFGWDGSFEPPQAYEISVWIMGGGGGRIREEGIRLGIETGTVIPTLDARCLVLVLCSMVNTGPQAYIIHSQTAHWHIPSPEVDGMFTLTSK